MPVNEQDPGDCEALQISDNLLQDLQGLLLRLHTSSDELQALLERVEGVVAEARERFGVATRSTDKGSS
jgi:signal transduction histidine kinase